jgi:hypothetical protein
MPRSDPLLDRGHAAAVLSQYETHFNSHRLHQGHSQLAPDDDTHVIPFQATRIERRRAVHGLINEYRPATQKTSTASEGITDRYGVNARMVNG